jgi:hypothetical protein
MCDGLSAEEVLAENREMIREFGFMVQGVVNPPGEGGQLVEWAYTVGLLDAVGHPELVVVGPQFERSGPLLQWMGRCVLEGERCAAGDRIVLGQDRLRIGTVHPVQYELTTFNVWYELAEDGAIEPAALEALQVFVPSAWFCSGHRRAQRDLSLPHTRFDAPVHVPSRAVRRAEQRRRGRR